MKLKHFFKTFIAFSILVLMSFQVKAEDQCMTVIVDHLKVVEESETLLANLGEKSSFISAHEITLLQRNLTARFNSLKNLLKRYSSEQDDSEGSCSPYLTGEAIAIYDFTLAQESIFADKHMRRIVTSLTKYYRYELTDYLNFYKKFTSNKVIRNNLKLVQENHLTLPIDLDYHPSLISLKTRFQKISDSTLSGSKALIGSLARAWGFISDSLKWREGKLRNNLEIQNHLLEKLKPLDLIYEKRSFLLSDYTIPGHWGHVAIWLGTKEELIALGIWDEEYFQPMRAFVEKGMNILEIRKEGLNFQSLSTFINLDEIAVTRVSDIHNRAAEVYKELSLQIDKKYDFKFDARSSDKITCSELIAFSYGNVNWKETRKFNQVSLSPDDLAVITLDSQSGVEFVTYFKEIKNVDKNAEENQKFVSLSFEEWKGLFKAEKKTAPVEKTTESSSEVTAYN